MATAIIPIGVGYNVGCDFNRTTEPTLIKIDHERNGYVFGYINGEPQSKLGFMRSTLVRVSVRSDLIQRFPY